MSAWADAGTAMTTVVAAEIQGSMSSSLADAFTSV